MEEEETVDFQNGLYLSRVLPHYLGGYSLWRAAGNDAWGKLSWIIFSAGWKSRYEECQEEARGLLRWAQDPSLSLLFPFLRGQGTWTWEAAQENLPRGCARIWRFGLILPGIWNLVSTEHGGLQRGAPEKMQEGGREQLHLHCSP